MSTQYDWSTLNSFFEKPSGNLKFAEVKDNFTKVAFDVYKENGSNKLWELRNEEGVDYLIALYDDADDNLKVESEGEWAATPDSSGENVTLSYNKFPIARFAGSQYNFTPSNVKDFASFLAKRASSEDFIKELLKTMPEKKRANVLRVLNKEVK